MASTITAGTLKVTIKEEIYLKGRNQGEITELSIASVNEIFKRIVSCAASTETTIAVFKSATGGSATFDSALDVEDVRYIRVTNLDDTNSVTLNLQIDVGEDDTGADESASILVGAGHSFIMSTTSDGLAVQDTNANIETDLHNLESIIIYPGSNAADIEIFVASV